MEWVGKEEERGRRGEEKRREREGGGGGEKVHTFLEGYLIIVSSSVVVDSNVARSTARRWRGRGLLLLWWGHLRSSCNGDNRKYGQLLQFRRNFTRIFGKSKSSWEKAFVYCSISTVSLIPVLCKFANNYFHP